MSDANAQSEPTMEEILSSIRRIISEDDEPPAEQPTEEPTSVEQILETEPEPDTEPVAEAQPEPAPEPEPIPEPAPEPAPIPEPDLDDDVMDLDQLIEDDGSVTDLSGDDGDDDLAFEDDLPPVPEPAMAPVMSAMDPGRLISDHAAADASASLAALAQTVSAQRDISVPTQRTLEDITKELLRPMLKDWLDANLPAIVQRIVEREISKLAGDVDDNKH